MGSLGDPSPIVLLTGATGFIGFRILLELAYQCVHIRAVVRSPEKSKWLEERLANVLEEKGGVYAHVLETRIVHHFVEEHAFDAAIEGTTYVIHVANPITSGDTQDDWQRDYIDGAVESTIRLLESAKRAATVKRIVITSSMVALFSPADLFAGSLEGSVLDAEMRTQEVSGPFAHKMLAYGAGKVTALHRAEQQWIQREQHQCGFDLIHMHPSFTIGRNELVTSAAELRQFSSNWHALQIVLGVQSPAGKPMLTCHVDDVARVHVKALHPKVAGNQSFLISCGHQKGTQWDDVKDLVLRQFPEAVRQQLVPNNGHMDTVNPNVRFDVSKTEKTFGFTHIAYETQTMDLVEQYVRLAEKEVS